MDQLVKSRKKIRFGIIGCSNIAETSVIPAIKESKFAEVEFIGSRNQKKAGLFAKKFGCKKFGDYQDVINDKNIDAVYISTPVSLHEKWAIKSAKMKKNILCEKSLSNSFQSVKKMVNIAKKNKVILFEGLMFRFHPSHKKILELNKKWGENFTFYSRYGFPAISKKNIRYNKKLGGGILNDAACYPIYASRMIFGKEPKKVNCVFQNDQKTGIDEKATILLTFDKNQTAQFSCGYKLEYQNIYSIWNEKGSISLERAYNIPPKMKPIITLQTQMRNDKIVIKSANHFTLMIDNFCKQLVSSKNVENNFKDILNQAKILEATRISAKNKSTIKVSEIK